MRRTFLTFLAGAVLASVFVPETAEACRVYRPPPLELAVEAELVVIGHVKSYQFFRDQELRKERLGAPGLSDETRESFADPNRILRQDAVRFEIEVEEVIVGSAPNSISAVGDAGIVLAEGRLAPGRYLMVLHRLGTMVVSGNDANLWRYFEPDAWTFLQPLCQGPFIFEADGQEARTILELLQTKSK